MRKTTIALVSLPAVIFGVPLAGAQPHDDKERAELAKAMKGARVSLAQGLTASAKDGKPISGKYEVEDGKLQLSVYTMKGDKYFEVIVDHKTGKVAKTEPITEGEDLADAMKQAAALAKGKRSLREVVLEVEGSNAGYKAVRVEPEVEGGAVEVNVDLLKGTETKHVEKKI